MRHVEHGLHLRRRTADYQLALDRPQLLEVLHQHPNARRAEKRDTGQVQSKAIVPVSHGLGEAAIQVLGPIAVESPVDRQLDAIVANVSHDLH